MHRKREKRESMGRPREQWVCFAVWWEKNWEVEERESGAAEEWEESPGLEGYKRQPILFIVALT